MNEPTHIDFGITRDGLTQLRRHWRADDPWAAAIVVHGIAEHSGRYGHVGARLADRGIETVAFDARGFGQSGGHRAYVGTFDEYLDDVEDHLAVARGLGVPVGLLGHSLGGLIALAYALGPDRPRPDFVVVSAPALGADVPWFLRRVAPVLGRTVPRLRVRNVFDPEVLSRDPAVQEGYASDDLMERSTTARLGAEMFATMDRVCARLAELDVPTLVVHGSDDRLVPPGHSEPLDLVECVERRVYPEYRHELFNEYGWERVVDDGVEWIRAVVDESP